MERGDALPAVLSPIPAATGKAWVERLAASECPALTTRRRRREEQTGASHDPIVWVDAQGANVIDADGKAMTDAASAKSGDEIRARLSKGELIAKITKVIKK